MRQPGVVVPVRDAAPAAASRPNWPLVRRLAAIVYFAGFALILVFAALETDRGSLLAAILVGLAIPCLGRGWRSYLRVLADWLPFTLVLYIYDYSRGLARWV